MINAITSTIGSKEVTTWYHMTEKSVHWSVTRFCSNF